MIHPRILPAILLFFIIISGCASANKKPVDSDQDKTQLRSIQSRIYNTSYRAYTLSAVNETLLNLGYETNQADRAIGIVSGTQPQTRVTISVTVTPPSGNQTLVHADMYIGDGKDSVTDSYPYEEFFSALDNHPFINDPNSTNSSAMNSLTQFLTGDGCLSWLVSMLIVDTLVWIIF